MGGQIINGNRLAKVGIEASELQMEVSADQVEMTTEEYYWKVVSLKEKLLTLATVHDMLEQLEKDVSNMVRVGAVNRNDLLLVQLRTTAEVENGLTTVRQLLAQHVGKADEAIDVTMPDGFSFDAVPDMPITLRQDHQLALAATPQYRLLEKNVEGYHLQHVMAVGSNLPSVGVGASYSYNDWFGKSSNAMIFATVSNAWAAVETSHKKLVIARDAITQSEENLRLNRDYYRVGTTKMTDLLFAQEQYQQARDRYTDAYADFQTKQLEYRQATGQE